MKKPLFLLSIALCFCAIVMAQNAHFHFKDGLKQTWSLTEIDSVTYLKPGAEVILPASCTVQAGTNSQLTYMVSDGVLTEPIIWGTTDSRIALFADNHLYAKKAGKCIIYATYKGVTSSCIITVTPSETSVTKDLTNLISYAPLVVYAVTEQSVYLSQALTTTSKSQTGSYPHSQGWNFLSSDYYPLWDLHCNDIVPIALHLIDYEQNFGKTTNVELIARTIRLMSTMYAVDLYGDMPCAELGRTLTPKYDSQEEIYGWMFQEVDELIKLYQSSNLQYTINIDASIDPIYGGEMNKWAAFCKGLKARLWLRKLPNWENNPSVCQNIINLVDDVINDYNWVEPYYYYPEENNPWGPKASRHSGVNPNRLSSSIPTTFFLHGILGSIDGTYQITRGYALDPRAERIMEPRSQYEGMLHLHSNMGMSIDNVISDFPDLLTQTTLTNPYTQNTSYLPLMTTEELLFIKAEAQYWTEDIQGAYNTTVAATKYNMKRYGLEETLLNNHTLNQYKRFFEIKFKENDFTLADLMQQKYVAMYLQPEQWTDMRRYNYSSSTNGILYNNVYVYDVKNVHNGRNALFIKDGENFTQTISLARPYNLYEPHWNTPDDFGTNAKLSPNAWIMRLIPRRTTYNQQELEQLGYYTTNTSGEKTIDYHTLKKRLIWAQKHNGPATSADSNITWQ